MPSGFLTRLRTPADPSLGAVGAGSDAGPHFLLRKGASLLRPERPPLPRAEPLHRGAMSGPSQPSLTPRKPTGHRALGDSGGDGNHAVGAWAKEFGRDPRICRN